MSRLNRHYDFCSIIAIPVGVDVRGSVRKSNKGATTYSSNVDLVRQCLAQHGVRGGMRAAEVGTDGRFGRSTHSIQSISIGVVFHSPR
jgi:hypothetical protein